MKKRFGVWLVFVPLLLGGCGNAAEEAAVLGEENVQESEAVEESGTSARETVFEQESEQDSEEAGTEEAETEEDITEAPETEESETKEPAATSEPMPEEPTYISREFLDFLEGYVMENKGVEALEGMACGQKLSKDDVLDYQSDPVVAEYISEGTFTKVDGDNDGIEDFYVRTPGGSIGNSFGHFLKGQEDGSFQDTSWTDSRLGEWSFIRYGETNYLVQTCYYYEPYGFVVTLYQDGEVLETLSMEKEMSYYEPNIRHLLAGYEETVEKYGEEGRSGWSEGVLYKLGTAETDEGNANYSADFDNDREEEQYHKFIFWRTGSLEEWLYTGKGKKNVSILETYGLEYEGIPEMFWVDGIGEKNVMFLLCFETNKRKMLYGYLIEGDEATTVLDIEFVGVPTIEYRIYTKGINYLQDPWSMKG